MTGEVGRKERIGVWESFLYTWIAFALIAFLLYIITLFQLALSGTKLFEFLWPAVGYGFQAPGLWFVEGFVEKMAMVYGGAANLVTGWLRNSVAEPQLTLIKSVFVLPLVKEIMWRGPLWFFQKASKSTLAYILVASILTLGYTLSHVAGPVNLLMVLLSGVSYAALVRLTERLWPAALLHAFLNIRGF